MLEFAHLLSLTHCRRSTQLYILIKKCPEPVSRQLLLKKLFHSEKCQLKCLKQIVTSALMFYCIVLT